ncbi:hypothetical protein HMPREF9700_00182 [Bergeyella zoohelcum CCUG 30536]|uniref:Uncharacterized protein n=1 Tax=Bergeyella zoohelcum TaxID=1015 RepID=A0A376BZY3_9FLAO|nr:hypothetical protein HMPREF9700_00182 [Bergeyella zoohelcum CCUG 30536]SSZ47223.1 Uncharacterised protein [Bergeyella zoohelcum]
MYCNYIFQAIIFLIFILIYIYLQIRYNDLAFKDKHKSIFEIIGNTYIEQSIIGLFAILLFFVLDKKPIFTFLFDLVGINICE